MEFLERIKDLYSNEDLEKIKVLYDILEKNSTLENVQEAFIRGQKTADFINTFLQDVNTTSACLLLEIVRKNLLDESLFEGFDVAIELCKKVVKIESINYNDQKVEYEDLRAMLVAIAKDIRVMIIKLCDVLYLARRPHLLTKDKLKNLHLEIKEVYSPLAGRLGLANIKSELNDLNLQYNHPKEYEKLEKEINNEAKKRQNDIDKIIEELTKAVKSQNIKCTIYGRMKHISSIYAKLKDKNYTLSKIYDLSAVRVIVNTVAECYAVMGIVHAKYAPLDNRFKDYIARPKENGYQSLHTTVLVNEDPLEIQIRTYDMHNHAEYGIAAHWLYKEHKSKGNSLDERLVWIRKILENKDNNSASEILEQLKTDVYSGDIFVQTPMGKIVQLVENATPIDFAYFIHSEVGNKCVGAKVNGKMVPLASTLANGDIVEIVTSQNSKGPSRDWLKVVKMQHSKNKIHSFFRKEMKDDNIKKGKLILEQAAKNKNISFKSLFCDKWQEALLEKLMVKSIDELFAGVGYGSISSASVMHKALTLYYQNTKKEDDIPKIISVKKRTTANIEGFETILTRFANCCSPIPDDEIVGYISHGCGITIHRKDCHSIKYLEPERFLDVTWAKELEGDGEYNANIKILINNKAGVLSLITNKLTENKINITFIKSEKTKYDDTILNIGLSVKSKQQLLDIIGKIKSLKDVIDVTR